MDRHLPFFSIFWNNTQHSRSLALRQNAGYAIGSGAAEAALLLGLSSGVGAVVVDDVVASGPPLLQLLEAVVALSSTTTTLSASNIPIVDVDVAFAICNAELSIANVMEENEYIASVKKPARISGMFETSSQFFVSLRTRKTRAMMGMLLTNAPKL